MRIECCNALRRFASHTVPECLYFRISFFYRCIAEILLETEQAILSRSETEEAYNSIGKRIAFVTELDDGTASVGCVGPESQCSLPSPAQQA